MNYIFKVILWLMRVFIGFFKMVNLIKGIPTNSILTKNGFSPARTSFVNASLNWVYPSLVTFFFFLMVQSIEAKEARIPAGEVLERAAEAWEKIHDYQAILHMVEQHPSGIQKENWARVSVVLATDETKDQGSACLIELFKQRVPLVNKAKVQNSTGSIANKVYFSDGVYLYTHDPKANTVKIEWLDETGPLPEFMQLAGFLELDIKELKKKAYLDDEVLDVEINGVPTYRVTIQPRQKMRDIEPIRYIWITRETNSPKRFASESEITLVVDFLDSLIDQGLVIDDIVPQVTNPRVYNLTR